MTRLYFIFSFLLLSHLICAQGSLNFDGINDYVQTSYAGVLGNSSRTMEAWIRTSKPSGPQQSIIDYGEFNSPNGRRFTLNVFGASSVLRLEIRGWGINGTTTLNDGMWHHVAATYDGTTVKVYVDCVLEASGAPTTTVNTASATSLPAGVRIGNRSNISSTYTSYFDGDIDEVRFWNVERTAAELCANKDSEINPAPANLTGYWKLNETMGDVASDSSPNANPGQLTNFALNGTGVSDWSPSTVLPVELTRFVATHNGDVVDLQWSTVQELNNDGFEIQRSNNASEFHEIGFVEGQGNSDQLKNYHFKDIEPSIGINYYRLKQIDHNGQSAYSNILVVRREAQHPHDALVYPNPVSSKLHIECQLINAEATVINALGRVVLNFSLSEKLSALDVSRLPSGSYILVIHNAKESILKKFVK